MKKPLKAGMYFNSIVLAEDLAVQLLDDEYPGWDDELKIAVCEMLYDPEYKGSIIIRGKVERK